MNQAPVGSPARVPGAGSVTKRCGPKHAAWAILMLGCNSATPSEGTASSCPTFLEGGEARDNRWWIERPREEFPHFVNPISGSYVLSDRPQSYNYWMEADVLILEDAILIGPRKAGPFVVYRTHIREVGPFVTVVRACLLTEETLPIGFPCRVFHFEWGRVRGGRDRVLRSPELKELYNLGDLYAYEQPIGEGPRRGG